jgi:anti-sigma B factor antagonist
MSLKIVAEPSNPSTIALAGRLDSSTAPELEAVLNRVLKNAQLPRLVFDLSQLEYLSSAGIRCFVRARKAIEPGGGRVAIVNPQPAVRKVLDIVKAVPAGGIFKDTAELDAYLDEMQRQVRDRD